MKLNQLIQISIPDPCHEDWGNMTPQEQGRFCSNCQMCVVDFTGFSDAQLYQFLAERKGQQICGRFNSTQLNRQINIPHQPHSTLYKWVIAAGLVLVFSATPVEKSFAQAPLIDTTLNTTLIDHHKGNVPVADSLIKISGTVIDENKEPVISALVTLKCGAVEESRLTDLDGSYEFYVTPNRYDLSVRYSGYKEWITTSIRGHNSVVVNARLRPIKLENNELETITVTIGKIAPHVPTKVNSKVKKKSPEPPLINKYESGGTRTITSDELERGAY